MIVGSFLLLLAGVVLLVAGLAAGNDTFLVGTIVASLVAAVCLYAASRRPRGADGDEREDTDRPEEYDARLRDRRADRSAAASRARDDSAFNEGPNQATAPRAEAEVGRRSSRQEHLEADARGREREPEREPERAAEADIDGVPGDEPTEVPMSSVEAAALMRMDAEVMVVDGRPRFHLGGCVHLVDRESEPLPAYEAVELGFTACSLCRPAQSLLREPTRH
ncbi:MAG TPA: hypothetical protein VE172_06765 [Stackebrandtia sp.]|uniref:hypothetical protein n=1 Tax=Stackebrandtia sp. TaxID=2023065 RepID=UPI002D72FAFB|nr:hypothetical protein [Stackebrandtia sp.]HZE38500.1 hypothetical protein [Stackebrandtia sp.]